MARTIPAPEGSEALRACAAAAAQGLVPPRDVQRTAVKFTLGLLVARAPGHSVEVRVPPFAAVQAVPGPTHRRGTPSAVIEMDAGTWIALATGDLDWAEGVAAGRVRASGERADLSPWLPLAMRA